MDKKGKIIDRAFDIGVILKGIDGFIEIIGGMLLFFISPAQINSFILLIAQHELSQDPKDILFNFLIKASQQLSVKAEIFTAIYFLTHGIIKVGLIAALLGKKLWAYPTAIIFFTAFGVYQIYRYFYSHAVSMLILTVFDIVIIVLTWMEYKRIKI